jgi:hypothetical protein
MIKLYDAQFFQGSSTRSEGAVVFTRPRPAAEVHAHPRKVLADAVIG